MLLWNQVTNNLKMICMFIVSWTRLPINNFCLVKKEEDYYKLNNDEQVFFYERVLQG